MKDIAEKEEDVDLTPHEHERALKGAYMSLIMPGKHKTDVDSYFDQAKPCIKALIENQLKEMGSVKIILTQWVFWKKTMKQLIKLDPDDTTDDINYEKIDIPSSSLMTKFFGASDIDDLLECMFAYIKPQTENPKFPESGFTLDKIMHLYINFHRVALTRGGSYIELPKWLKSKKAVINPQNKDEECFKWAVIAALHHEVIKDNLERISLLSLIKNNIIGKDSSFQYRLRRLISLKRTTLT